MRISDEGTVGVRANSKAEHKIIDTSSKMNNLNNYYG